MSCECAQCRQHYRTLGIAFGIPSESETQQAYQESAKQWNPEFFEGYASLRADAEEHFNQIQIAYRELKEHNATPGELPVESVAVKPEEASSISPFISSPISSPISPSISSSISPSILFDDAPGCLVAQQFTVDVEEVIARYLGKIDTALAIVDLDGARSHPADYSHFLLLAARGIMVRDARNLVSLLWYKDLGDVHLVDKRKDGKLSLSQRLLENISGSHHYCSLHLYRSDGNRFLSITDQVDDNTKKVIYNFLLQQKTQVNP